MALVQLSAQALAPRKRSAVMPLVPLALLVVLRLAPRPKSRGRRLLVSQVEFFCVLELNLLVAGGIVGGVAGTVGGVVGGAACAVGGAAVSTTGNI